MGFTEWFADHLLITYLIIFAFTVFIYNKVFRVRKLPILKEIIVYIMIGLGSLMLLLFQVDASLPIIPSLAVAIIMMVMYHFRVMYVTWRNKTRQDQSK